MSKKQKKVRLTGYFFCLLLLFFNLSGLAYEPVDVEVAKKAAEYHGEMIYEKDLKVCDHELLYWPSGEQAVYVFVLMAEGDFYPQDIKLDNTILKGAYLVSIGKEEEGYNLMAQSDRYMTVVVGATTDMPSFIRAQAGLPEHLLHLKIMENPPLDPYWIYADLFHTLIGSRVDMGLTESRAIEIHLEQTIALKDLGIEKVGTVPEYAEELEWGAFMNPDVVKIADENPYLINVPGVKEGKHQLPVTEHAKAAFVGCSPAAFVNCLKYLEKRRKVRTKGKSINELLEWTAICYRTDPANKGTSPSWIVKGSKLMFKGLGYNANVSVYARQDSKPALFLTKFADEINAKYPCNLGGTGKGIFQGHSTTGIGYWKQGTHYRLIIHDGWAGNDPVYVKYLGYPNAELQYPKYMRNFRPKGAKSFTKAKPKVKAPKEVQWNTGNQRWRWKCKLISKNAVKVQAYKEEYKLYDSKGHKYHDIPGTRIKPYFTGSTTTMRKPGDKRGKVECKFYLVDDNGHLLEAKKTVKIEDIIGKWQLNFNWTGIGGGSATLTVNKNGTFQTDDGGSGTWTLNKRSVTFRFQTGQRPIYSGTVNKKYSYMSGTMVTTTGKRHTGTWNAKRLSDGAIEKEEYGHDSKINSSGSCRDDSCH